ncbi:transposase, partial [Vibrio parahaemolyticus]
RRKDVAPSLLWMVQDGIQKKLPMTLNVSVIKLSPYSPEPNPIEQVWRWLRPRYLANQSFTDYHNIISKVCDA